MYEELPPIDFNPNYDFNFQQFTYLPKEVIVLRVSFIKFNSCAISISHPWPAKNSEVLIEPRPQAHSCLIARTAGNGSGDEAIILGD